MSRTRFLLSLGLLAGCQSYEAAPVDLAAHAAAFAARLPDAAALQHYQAQLASGAARGPAAFDLADGLDLAEGRLCALWFHPDCRQSRLAAGVALASAAEAGRWRDPVLQTDSWRVLDDVPKPWLLANQLQLTVPISGRLGRERELADGEAQAALLAAQGTEQDAQNDLDAAWVRWSAAAEQQQLVADLHARLGELEQVAARLHGAGALTAAEARLFALERVQREAELGLARAEAVAAEVELKQALGLHPAAPVRLRPQLQVPPHAADAAARQAQLATSPRVQPLQAAHDVAERRLALAVAEQYPDVTLVPGYQEEGTIQRVTLGLLLPLPFWNRNARAIATARADRDRAAEALRGALETATQDLAAAEVRLAAAAAQQQLVAEQLLPLAEAQLADSQKSLALGELQPLLLLDAVLRVHQAKVQALAAARHRAEATIAANRLCWTPGTAPLPTEPATPAATPAPAEEAR